MADGGLGTFFSPHRASSSEQGWELAEASAPGLHLSPGSSGELLTQVTRVLC